MRAVLLAGAAVGFGLVVMGAPLEALGVLGVLAILDRTVGRP